VHASPVIIFIVTGQHRRSPSYRTIPGANDFACCLWPDRGTRNAMYAGERPVHTYTLTDEVDYIEPKARVY
jgi:hypothetical protein